MPDHESARDRVLEAADHLGNAMNAQSVGDWTAYATYLWQAAFVCIREMMRAEGK